MVQLLGTCSLLRLQDPATGDLGFILSNRKQAYESPTTNPTLNHFLSTGTKQRWGRGRSEKGGGTEKRWEQAAGRS